MKSESYILIEYSDLSELWGSTCRRQYLIEKKINMTKDEAFDLNKQLLLNGESKRYIREELTNNE